MSPTEDEVEDDLGRSCWPLSDLRQPLGLGQGESDVERFLRVRVGSLKFSRGPASEENLGSSLKSSGIASRANISEMEVGKGTLAEGHDISPASEKVRVV